VGKNWPNDQQGESTTQFKLHFDTINSFTEKIPV